MKKIYIISITILFIIFLISISYARVGGGHSFGGGRSSGSSRSSGGYHSSGSYHSSGGGSYSSYSGGGGGSGPASTFSGIMFLVFVGLMVCVLYLKQKEDEKNGGRKMNNLYSVGYNSSGSTNSFQFSLLHALLGFFLGFNSSVRPAPFQPMRRTVSIAESIKNYKYKDPNFSKPLFLDFIQIFYTKVQVARGNKSWDSLRPYLSINSISAYRTSDDPEKVDNIIIGSSNIVNIDTFKTFDKIYDRIEVEFEANYSEHIRGNEKIYYVKEKWTLKRKPGILSKGPEDISSFHCPSCGSPVELRLNGTCNHCDKIVTGGDFHWQLHMIKIIEKYPRPPLQVGGGGIEEGTDLPTVFQPNFEAAKRAFLTRYPNFNPKEFSRKVRDTFMKLQHAWSTCNWEAARPLETDYLFSMHKYWIEQYKAEGMRNILEDIEILSITTVKIEEDAFYEAITVRIKASMKDYTIDRNGKVVDGSKTVKRTFSEYWTFIRRAGFAGDTKEKKENTCPNCGGELQISMAGICEYCGSKITSGNFDWILSTIEQDEVYVSEQ